MIVNGKDCKKYGCNLYPCHREQCKRQVTFNGMTLITYIADDKNSQRLRNQEKRVLYREINIYTYES